MCPVCGLRTSAEPGESVPMHQQPGTRELCPGSGQTAT